MTKKAKKLGVKTKLPVFEDDNFEVNKPSDEKDESISNETESNDEPKSNGNAEELDKLCSTIDKLSLDMLILMQNHMKHKLRIEKCMTDGELHLSKSRYIMGHKNVSSLQLPLETNVDIDPSITVKEINSEDLSFGAPQLEMIVEKFTKQNKNEESGEKNIQDPIKWFGVLVPANLKQAQSKFRDALTSAVDCANVQIKLHQTSVKIKQLQKLKEEMLQAEE